MLLWNGNQGCVPVDPVVDLSLHVTNIVRTALIYYCQLTHKIHVSQYSDGKIFETSYWLPNPLLTQIFDAYIYD